LLSCFARIYWLQSKNSEESAISKR